MHNVMLIDQRMIVAYTEELMKLATKNHYSAFLKQSRLRDLSRMFRYLESKKIHIIADPKKNKAHSHSIHN